MIDFLFKQGIPSYRTTVFTPVPASVSSSFSIASQLPKQIGIIFGLEIYTDTVTPDNNPLITFANAQSLYINLKIGMTDFYESVRLDELVMLFPVTNTSRNYPYLPANIPSAVDLSQSKYINPTGIITGTIALTLWYVDLDTSRMLMKSGVINPKNGMLLQKGI